MRGVPTWRRYLRFWGADVGADVDDEFAFHLQEREEELTAAGLSPEQAREAARRSFGDLERVKSTCRELAQERERVMRRQEWFGVLRQDVRFAFRQMRAQWLPSAAALVTLALSIGATTALFSVVYAVLLQPLPWADADRIVHLWETVGDFPRGRASTGHFHDWREQAGTLEASAALVSRSYNLTEGDAPERASGAAVTADYFRVLHMPPARGRYFQPDDAGRRVVVISHELWQDRFGGDAAVIGRSIQLSGEPHRVIGVTPAGFTITPRGERLWTPLEFAPEERHDYGSHGLLVIAKLRSGVSVAEAAADVARVTEDIRARVPGNMQQRGSNVESYQQHLVASYRTQLLVLLGAVAFVLLIACANVASLLLARATSRRKELVLRAALGGARTRLVRQLLTESLVLALSGGLVGTALAYGGVRMLIAAAPQDVPRLQQAGLEPPVLLFALAATLLCGLVFGLAPALRATRTDLQAVLREGGRSSSSGNARDRLRSVLVIAEVAVALVLVVGAGLFLRSAQHVASVPLGFRADDLTMARATLPPERYPDAERVHDAYRRLLAELDAEPGIVEVAAATRVPLVGMSVDIGLDVAGRAEPPLVGAHIRMVSNDYFDVLDIPLRRGRAFRGDDFAGGAPPVVLINEALARRVFGAEDPIGQRVSGWSSAPQPEWREIVGIVADVRSFGRERDAQPEIYIPFTQAPAGATDLLRNLTLIASGADGRSVAALMRNAVTRADPDLPLYDVQRFGDVVAENTAARRFSSMLLALLGATGLLLAAVGIYGVIAFFVSQRIPEIGIRMALGATGANVLTLVLRHGALLTAAGLVGGALAAAALTRVLRSMLFGVTALDPLTFLAALAVLALTALLAAAIPALRAARADPASSLRG